MLEIYHIEGRRSERVVWLMEEIGAPYELKFTPGDLMASGQAIRAVHPIGAAPTIRDGDLMLCESGAILEYIMARYDGMRFRLPPDHAEYGLYQQWMHFAEGFAMNRIMSEFALQPFKEEAAKSPTAMLYLGSTERLFNFYESSLAGRTYFAGETFTTADIMMQMPIRISRGAGRLEAFPNIRTWRERVESRPAFERMLKITMPNGRPPRLSARA
jgi:glutathione S-transferase